MKIKISFDENLICDNQEIEIDEYQTVRSIRVRIYQILREKRKKTPEEYFHLIYHNILLDNNKLIKYYKMVPDDEIWIGKLEQYLKNDDIIAELFIGGLVSSFMYLIVNRNHSISQIKSIIFKSIPNVVNIWDVNGNEMRNNQFITETDLIGGYFKLIVDNYKDANKTFIDWCAVHDKYFAWNFVTKIGVSIHATNLFLQYVNEPKRTILINKIIDIRHNLPIDEILSAKLNKNLSSIPSSFLNSKFLFSMDITERIWDVCEVYWANNISKYASGFHGFVGSVFKTELCNLLLVYAKYRQRDTKNPNKSMMSVVIEAIDNLLDLLNGVNDNTFCLTRFLQNFGLAKYCDGEKENILISENTLGSFFKMRGTDNDIELVVPRENISTIIQLKTTISAQTNVPIQQIYIVQNSVDDTPDDNDNIDSLDRYFFEIMSSTDNIDFLKLLGEGAFGAVYLCQDKITKKFLALKKPKGKCSDLVRDINIQKLLCFSENIARYSGLFRCNEETCMATEYFSGGSLRSYLDKLGYLSERNVAKISYEILIQINELHFRGIIHRDIKCDNVVLDNHNNPKIIDFGLSKFIEGIPLNELIELLRKKRKIYAPGTMFYMAPELIKSESYSNKVDIWSFGMMVIEMVTGKRPFQNLQPHQVIIKISRGENIDIDPPIPISDEMKEFIDSCLKVNPDKRSSAKQLIDSKFITNYLNEQNMCNVTSVM